MAEFAAGALFFADDGVVTEGFVGGSPVSMCCRESALDRKSRTSGATTTIT